MRLVLMVVVVLTAQLGQLVPPLVMEGLGVLGLAAAMLLVAEYIIQVV